MHQRATLQAGEDGAVDGFLVLRFHQNDAAARAAQAFVGGAGHHVSVWHGVGVDAGGNQAGVVRHVHHKDGAHVFGDLGKASKVDAQAVGGGTGDDQFRFGLVGFSLHGVVVDLFLVVQAVTDDVEPLATHVQCHAVRQVSAFSQAHAHDGVAGFQKGQKHRLVGGRAAMGLHVGGLGAKDLFDAINGQLLGNVHKLATAVVAFAGVALSILISQLRALRGHDGGGGVVFAGNQLDVLFLAGVFRCNSGKNFGVGLFDEDVTVVHGSP